MFVEEAEWIRTRLAALPLGPATRVLDIGSSTLEYRTVRQPHITTLVHQPLGARGCAITCADIKDGEGVDLVVDLSRADLPPAVEVPPFDLVICSNILEHVVDRAVFIRNALRFVAPGGFFLCTVPRVFPYHADPLDTMYRPSVEDLSRDLLAGARGHLEASTVLRIDDRSYYDFAPGRILDHLLLRAPRLAFRWHVPALRWRVTCVLLRIEAGPGGQP